MFHLDDQFDRQGALARGRRQSRVQKERALGIAPRARPVAIAGQGLAGCVHAAFIEIACHIGTAEGVRPDIVHEGDERVALAAGQRLVGRLVDHLFRLHHVIDQQQRGFFLGHLDAMARSGPMAVAHDPASVAALFGSGAERLEPFDQVTGSRR